VDPDPQGSEILCHTDPELEISDTDLDLDPELEKTLKNYHKIRNFIIILKIMF
jgi:hypothetical protein